MTRQTALEWALRALEDISSDPQYTDEDEFRIIESRVIPIIREMIKEVSKN